MGKETGIAWCDHTFNPWWGCTKIAPECAKCYAETMAKRTGHHVWGDTAPRRFFGEKHWREPLIWNAAAKRDGVRRRVFCASMADVFEARPDLDPPRAMLWRLIDATPELDWLLLTKRPENIRHMLTGPVHKNIWLGTTGGTKDTVGVNVRELYQNIGYVTFLSMEPLLERVDISSCFRGKLEPGNSWAACLCDEIDPSDKPCVVCEAQMGIDWVIAGCESGPKARPMDDDWVRELRDQCAGAGVPFFFKQAMRGGKLVSLPELDGQVWAQFPKAKP